MEGSSRGPGESLSSDESPLRPPLQARSQKTLDRIVEAALELMEEGGVEKATVGAIVQRAESSVGSFYARFSGKDDLIRYLRGRVWADARQRWDNALQERDWEKLTMEEVVEGVVALLVRSFRADYRQRRVLGREWRQDAEGARRVVEFHEHLLATVTPLLLNHREEISHPEPERAVRLGYRFTVGGIREILELEEAAGIVDNAASMEGLLPELARAWIAYLGVGKRGESEEDETGVDFFDPWG